MHIIKTDFIINAIEESFKFVKDLARFDEAAKFFCQLCIHEPYTERAVDAQKANEKKKTEMRPERVFLFSISINRNKCSVLRDGARITMKENMKNCAVLNVKCHTQTSNHQRNHQSNNNTCTVWVWACHNGSVGVSADCITTNTSTTFRRTHSQRAYQTVRSLRSTRTTRSNPIRAQLRWLANFARESFNSVSTYVDGDSILCAPLCLFTSDSPELYLYISQNFINSSQQISLNFMCFHHTSRQLVFV